MAVRRFPQLAKPVSEEFEIGRIVVGNFLPYAGRVTRTDDGRQLVEFVPATIDELRQRMREIWGFDPEKSEEWPEMVEVQKKYL